MARRPTPAKKRPAGQSGALPKRQAGTRSGAWTPGKNVDRPELRRLARVAKDNQALEQKAHELTKQELKQTKEQMIEMRTQMDLQTEQVAIAQAIDIPQ